MLLTRVQCGHIHLGMGLSLSPISACLKGDKGQNWLVIVVTWVVVFPLLWEVSWDTPGSRRAAVLQTVICGNRGLSSLSRAGTELPVPSSGPGESPF